MFESENLTFILIKPPFFSEDPDEMNRNILNAPLSFSDDFSPQARILLIGVRNFFFFRIHFFKRFAIIQSF